jgi:hypothetical protein
MRKSRRAFWGLLLVVVGGVLLAEALGSEVPGFDQIWPALLVIGGLAALVTYLMGDRRNTSQVFLGLVAFLAGVLFFFITLGRLEYEDLEVWWPVFLLIGALGWLGQWAATRFRDWGAFFLAMVALVIGAAGMAVALELLGADTAGSLPRLWPVLLIVGGLMVFLRAALGRRS